MPQGGLIHPKDGVSWQIGTAADIAWIAQGTVSGPTITAAIPSVFAAYATVTVPDLGPARQAHERALLEILGARGTGAWWLGFLDDGVADVIFPDAPRVRLYADWPYVLVLAGPDQAARWRTAGAWRGALPELMFPVDRSWQVATLWDDDWTCIGGPSELIGELLSDERLEARAVDVAEDAAPPGHRRM
jgi:hypothetical protein